MCDVIRVLAGDSHPIFCEGIKGAIAHSRELSFVGSATHQMRLLSMCAELRPNIVLLSPDIGTPDCLEVVSETVQLPFTPKVMGLLSEQDDARFC